MPMNLNSPKAVSKTVGGYEITSFAVDIDRAEIVIGYDALDENGNRVGQETAVVVDGPNFAAAIGRASTNAGADVYAALKLALYDEVTAVTGDSGTVV